MTFKKLDYTYIDKEKMIQKSEDLLLRARERRSVREFSDKKVSIIIIKNAIKTAISAPSGADKQPWHFVVVKNKTLKSKIRVAAEKEEKDFYSHRASKEWLKDLNQFKTNWKKPFLEKAPFLITVFKEIYDLNASEKKKNYYVNESVGIACGFLLMSLHNSGLVCLPHTPSPMSFLEQILERPKNQKAFLLIPVGYPSKETMVPNLVKKKFKEACTIK